MTWVFDDDPANQQVLELTFSETSGATTVRLVNTGISSDERRDNQEWGWIECLGELERLLAG